MLSDGLISSPLRFLRGSVFLPLVNIAGRRGLLSIDHVATTPGKSGASTGPDGGPSNYEAVAICISTIQTKNAVGNIPGPKLGLSLPPPSSCLIILCPPAVEASRPSNSRATWSEASYNEAKAFIHTFCSTGRIAKGVGAINLGPCAISALRFIEDSTSASHCLVAASSEGAIFVFKPSLQDERHDGEAFRRYTLCSSFHLYNGHPAASNQLRHIEFHLDAAALHMVWEQRGEDNGEPIDSKSTIQACAVDINATSPNYVRRPGVLLRLEGRVGTIIHAGRSSGDLWISLPSDATLYFYHRRTKRVHKVALKSAFVSMAANYNGGVESALVICRDGTLHRVSFIEHAARLSSWYVTRMLAPGVVCGNLINIRAHIIEDVLVLSRGYVSASLPLHVLRDTESNLTLVADRDSFFDFSAILCGEPSKFVSKHVNMNVFHHHSPRLLVSTRQCICDAGLIADALGTADESRRPFIRLFEPSRIYIPPARLIRELSISEAFSESCAGAEVIVSKAIAVSENDSALRDSKPRIVTLFPMPAPPADCLGWLKEKNSLLLPPLQCSGSKIEDFLTLGDLIKIATEEAFAYRKLKDAVDENNTWKTTYDDEATKEEVVDMAVEGHFARICMLFWSEYPVYFYDLIRHLETLRGGWRGDSSRSLVNYKAQLYGYFGEPVEEEADEEDIEDAWGEAGDDDDGDDDDDAGSGSQEDSQEDDEVPTARDLVKLKSHYVDRVIKILHFGEEESEEASVDVTSFSLVQIQSLLKLLIWAGRYELAVDLLIRTRRADEVVQLLIAMHSYLEAPETSDEVKEPLRGSFERCCLKALGSLTGLQRESVLNIAPFCEVVKTESMAI